ncbi:MAG: hypothetical protein ACTSXD_02135 [Candidatus Heimdallarchaeaceae archaeon]
MSDKKVMEDLIKEKNTLVAAVEELDSQLNKYRELGTVDEIDEALTKAKAIVEKVKQINLATVEYDMKQLAEYRELGSVEQIDEAIDKSIETISVYKELGKPEEIDELLEKATSLLEQYSILGKPSEIEKILDMYQEKIISSRCEEIGAKFNVDSSLVKKMYEKANDFDTVEELLELSFGRKISAPKKEEKIEKKTERKEPKKLTVESKKATAHNLKKLVQGLM